jgi:hypothetical protein
MVKNVEELDRWMKLGPHSWEKEVRMIWEMNVVFFKTTTSTYAIMNQVPLDGMVGQ